MNYGKSKTRPLFVEGDGGCPAYLACRDHSNKVDTRAFLEDAWSAYSALIGDREAHFLSEFRRNFHAKAWELYLIAVLARAGITITQGTPNGPDIRASIGGATVWIEATTATPGAPGSADEVFQRPPGRWAGALYSEASLLLRYRSAIEDKLRKIQEYQTRGIVGMNDAALIAVNQGMIVDSDLHDEEIPAMAKAVFPIGEPVGIVDPYGVEPFHVEVPSRTSVRKIATGTEISTTLFLEPRAAPISGVLFAPQLVWALQLSASADLRLIHNPLARRPMPRTVIPLRCEMWLENQELRHVGRCSNAETRKSAR